MFHYDFRPRGVCSQAIHVDLSDDGTIIEGVAFMVAATATSRPLASWSRASPSTRSQTFLTATPAALAAPPVQIS